MKIIFFTILAFTFACSQDQNLKRTNSLLKQTETKPEPTCTESVANNGNTIKVCTLVNENSKIVLITELATDSVFFDRSYLRNIYEQRIDFFANGHEKKSQIINHKKKEYTTNEGLKLIGVDNFVYSVFTLKLDSSFVYVLDGIGYNSTNEVTEFRRVFSSTGNLIFDGYKEDNNYEKLENFWQLNNVTFNHIREARKGALQTTF